jgi:hypothetical protein
VEHRAVAEGIGGLRRRSRTNRQLDLKRHLHPGYHGPRWTPQELALLGTMPDDEVAAQIGKTPLASSFAKTT